MADGLLIQRKIYTKNFSTTRKILDSLIYGIYFRAKNYNSKPTVSDEWNMYYLLFIATEYLS